MIRSPAEVAYEKAVKQVVTQLRANFRNGSTVDRATQGAVDVLLTCLVEEQPKILMPGQPTRIETTLIIESAMGIVCRILQTLPPYLHAKLMQDMTLAMVDIFGRDELHPWHPLYLKHIEGRPDGAPANDATPKIN